MAGSSGVGVLAGILSRAENRRGKFKRGRKVSSEGGEFAIVFSPEVCVNILVVGYLVVPSACL